MQRTSRLVTLQGALNFRDLGGYPTAEGGEVRWGQVYRSAALHRLTTADLIAVADLGLQVVYDLRSADERERSPSILPDGIRTEWLPIGGRAANTQGLSDLIVAGSLGEVPEDFLLQIYEAMVRDAAPTFGQLLTMLAASDGMPALFHCTAGKDRTGMTAALLLSLLGVDEQTILDDFELSAVLYTDQQMSRLRLRRRIEDDGMDLDHYRRVFGAPRESMATVLTGLGERHGSIEAYLLDEAAVTPEVIATLRARLVEAP
jgi:protein-tyrosine phosphatase